MTMKFFKALSDEEVSGREVQLSDTLILSLQLDSQYTGKLYIIDDGVERPGLEGGLQGS